MILKNILVASVLATVAAFGVGCGGSKCDNAAEKVAECLGASDDAQDSVEDNAEEQECSAQRECQSECVTEADCEVITGKSTDEEAKGEYADCIKACG